MKEVFSPQERCSTRQRSCSYFVLNTYACIECTEGGRSGDYVPGMMSLQPGEIFFIPFSDESGNSKHLDFFSKMRALNAPKEVALENMFQA